MTLTFLRPCRRCGDSGWYRPSDPAGNVPSERCTDCRAGREPVGKSDAPAPSLAPWAWTWVREGTAPWFPMRGDNPNVAGGYTKGDAILHPDEARTLRAAAESPGLGIGLGWAEDAATEAVRLCSACRRRFTARSRFLFRCGPCRSDANRKREEA